MILVENHKFRSQLLLTQRKATILITSAIYHQLLVETYSLELNILETRNFEYTKSLPVLLDIVQVVSRFNCRFPCHPLK